MKLQQKYILCNFIVKQRISYDTPTMIGIKWQMDVKFVPKVQWGGYIGVLSYQKNPIKIAHTLELLAFYSENVKITFYEKLLGKQVADMPDDAAMLEIIWDSVTTDIGQTFVGAGTGSDRGLCYTVPELMWPSSTQNLASFVKTKENMINDGFKAFLKEIKSNQ